MARTWKDEKSYDDRHCMICMLLNAYIVDACVDCGSSMRWNHVIWKVHLLLYNHFFRCELIWNWKRYKKISWGNLE